MALRDAPPPTSTAPLEKRARRGLFETARAEEGVVYFVSDVALAEKLLALGLGFLRGGVHEGAPWLLRDARVRSLADLAKGERVPFESAREIVVAVARDLARCESAHVFPGPIAPEEITLGASGAAYVEARHYLHAIARADATFGLARGSGPSPKYTPPEQLDGAPWDSAANRYVLGLVLYRLLAGELPRTSDGARAAFSAGRAEVSPLPEDVAERLPPGMHAFLLRVLSPDPARRPGSADEIARELSRTSERKVKVARGKTSRASDVDHAPVAVEAAPPKKTLAARLRAVAALLVAGVAIYAGLRSIAREDAADLAPVHASLHERPLAANDGAAGACAGCHAREVSEWRRSVMSHAATSPLFGALESVVEEQVGRSAECPNGAGILRKRGADACVDRASGTSLTGAGGEHWCVNCHLPGENLRGQVPAWSAFASSSLASSSRVSPRAPVRDLASASSMEGISCISCHTTVGPAHSGQAYQGNASWTSVKTGAVFFARPEDAQGRFGIGNSGYSLDPSSFFASAALTTGARVHKLPTEPERAYLRSSEFCGSCHDVRLFGTDVLGARDRGEHFKRLRNGYTEWRAWANDEARAGRTAATCQDCHMTTFPGVCVQDASSAGGAGCPAGTRFSARAPGDRGVGQHVSHDFTSVEVPLAADARGLSADDPALDPEGVPLGLSARQTMLVARALTMEVEPPRLDAGVLRVPVAVTNTGAGHRVPAGFSQEREIWVELTVTDADGRTVYEVGKVARAEEDLADKRFLRVRTDDGAVDGRGRPLGLFGADVADGPDAPRWRETAPHERTGQGLINLQNGFLRCVRCIGIIDASGACQPGPNQGITRADRYDDGDYDLDTGECRSNLSGDNALFETFFPIGGLDADRGLTRAPDAIIDTRSAAPGVRQRWVYDLRIGAHKPPFTVRAKLHFRAFPPYLLRAFAEYEARAAARGERPSGAQVTPAHLAKLRILDVAEAVVHGP